MTDFASLVLAVDSTAVKSGTAELDRLTTAGGKAEGSAQNLTRAKNQEAQAMKAAALEAERTAAGLVKASSAAGKARIESLQLAAAGDAVVKSNGAQKAGMQQLSYQLGDVATQFSMGTKVSQIFAQQAGQTLQAVSLLAGGTGRFAAFLTSGWGVALSVGAVALAPFISKLFEASRAARAVEDAVKDMVAAQRSATAEIFKLQNAQIGLAQKQAQLATVEASLAKSQNDPLSFLNFRARSERTRLQEEALNLRAQILEETRKRSSLPVSDPATNNIREQLFGPKATADLDKHTAALGRSTGALKTHAAAVGGAGKAYKAAATEFEQYWAAVDKLDKLKAQAGFSQGEFGFGEAAQHFREEMDAALDPMAKAVPLAQEIADGFERGGDQLERQIDLVGALVGALGNVGSFGGAGGSIGGLINAFTTLDPKTGKPSKDATIAGLLNMGGPLGTVLSVALKPSLVGDMGKDISGGLQSLGLGKGISGVLGKGLSGAGVGLSVASLIGNGSKGANIGGAIGGAIGSAIPIPGASLVLSAIGSLIGGLFKKTTKGSAFISNSGVSTSGNDDKLIGQISELGNGLQSSISQIAQALGVDVGSYNVAIAQRSSGFIHVDAAGSANVGDQNWIKSAGANALYNGKDMAEAMKAAFKNAVEDGAFKGLSETIKRLILGGGDVDAQVQKAVTLQTALKAAVFEADPLGEALKAVAKEMDNLRAIAAEAGATEAETAQIEELAAAKRKAVLDAAGQFIEDNFYSDAEKLAKAAGAVDDVFAKLNITNVTTREQFRDLVKGIDLTSEAGTKLYGELLKIAPQFLVVTQAVDLAAQAAAILEQQMAEAAKQAEAQAAILAGQRTDLQIRLLEALGEKEAALAMQRGKALEATDETLRGLQLQVYWAEDVAKARDVLSASYKRERGEIEATAKKYRDHADALRTYRQSLFGNDVGASGYAQTLARLKSAGAMAALGNEASSSALPGLGKSFLDASRGQAKTAADYQRDVALVAGIVDKAIAGNDSMANAADQQIKALEASVQGLIDLNDGVTTTNAAIADLRKLLDEPTVSIADSNLKQVDVLGDIRVELNRLRSDGSANADDLRIALTTLSGALARIATVITGADAGGALFVTTASGDTVTTVAA